MDLMDGATDIYFQFLLSFPSSFLLLGWSFCCCHQVVVKTKQQQQQVPLFSHTPLTLASHANCVRVCDCPPTSPCRRPDTQRLNRNDFAFERIDERVFNTKRKMFLPLIYLQVGRSHRVASYRWSRCLTRRRANRVISFWRGG